MKEIELFNQKQTKKNLLDLRAGDKVKVWQKIKEGDRQRLQAFEGVVIAIKHGRGISATFTVRKVSGGIGVERIFPLHSPVIEKIEVLGHSKVRRAKLYYLRGRKGKRARMKMILEKSGVKIEEESELSVDLPVGKAGTPAEEEEKIEEKIE